MAHNYDIFPMMIDLVVQADGSDLAGLDADITIEEVDGHVFYDPIPGDMLVTREDNPQVRVTINNINAQ